MEVKPQDHPDYVGGIIWSDCELRWINNKLSELTSLRAFKVACEKQEAIVWCCQGDINAFKKKHAATIGGFGSGSTPLYLHPDPEAAQLRMRVAELESQGKAVCDRNDELFIKWRDAEEQFAAATSQRDELVRLCSMTLSMLLSEPDTKGALFKAESLLREAVAEAKGKL